ncbi:MAG: 1-acyl-sn-glycerol-3-phosphate acyltransferase [Clostridia bacterium]|nr:1-acyl-sn-glycerol-3-phosphate acyltransferase [Clostridia bacterium]
MKKKKKKKWIRPHHLWVRNLLMPFIYCYSLLKYGIKIERFEADNKRPHLILYNHQTAFDQFFVGMVYPGAIYYVASEDLFSNGFISSLIKFLVNPIPIKKSTTDIRAVLNCMQVAKEGGTIAIAPEGNRTFSGETGFIKPGIASLILALKLPVAFLHLEGGYGVHPRWSDVKRKGTMRAYISRVIEPEEFRTMSEADILATVEKELYVDESICKTRFSHKKSAEYLERAIFYCPECGISEFESHGKEITCKHCNLTAIYGDDLKFTSTNDHFPYSNVKEWYKAQSDYVNGLDVDSLINTKICCDSAKLLEVIPYKKKIKMGTVDLSLYGDRITAEGSTTLTFVFDEVSAISVLGRNKLNIYVKDKIYQIKSSKRFNAVKYMNLYYRYANVKNGATASDYLGI